MNCCTTRGVSDDNSFSDHKYISFDIYFKGSDVLHYKHCNVIQHIHLKSNLAFNDVTSSCILFHGICCKPTCIGTVTSTLSKMKYTSGIPFLSHSTTLFN